MKYFLEIRTTKPDGSEVTFRKLVPGNDWEAARAMVLETAAKAVSNPLKDLKIDGNMASFLNDYGGWSTVYAAKYGDHSQVKEGIFVL